MKHILIFILLCLLTLQGFSQQIPKTEVLGLGCEDSIVISPVLKITDHTVKRLLESIVHGEKNGNYYTNSNCYNIIIDRRNNVGALCKMYIDVDDFSYASHIWEIRYPYYYGNMYYDSRLFMIYGEDANFFFKKTKRTQNIVIKYTPAPYDESIIRISTDPLMNWCYYYKDKWYKCDSDKNKCMYYNYKERKWVESE